MPTVVTEDGYRFKIYPNDHIPAHVHVQKPENEARVALETFEVVSNEGFNSRELRAVVELVEKHQATLLSVWDT
jgi:hypothetical protein